MKIAALIGEPASGKTTLTKRILSQLTPGEDFKAGLVHGTLHRQEKVIVLGKYEPWNTFAGPDQFSMACQRDAEFFITQADFQKPDWAIFFEGDRLGCLKFLKYCQETGDLRVFVLLTSEDEKKRRHSQRNDSQTEKFLKGRATKIRNLIEQFPASKLLKNELTEDTERNAKEILDFLLEKK